MSITKEQWQGAYNLGVEAAKEAASWIVDGNTKREFIPAVLEMMEDGDPAVWDYLPPMPDLSGEWADSPTPESVAADVLGADWEVHGHNAPDFIAADAVSAVVDAWEEGVAETFEQECERILRQALV